MHEPKRDQSNDSLFTISVTGKVLRVSVAMKDQGKEGAGQGPGVL